MAAALDELRRSRTILEARTAHKRRCMDANARTMIEMGMRRHTNGRLQNADQHTLRRLFRSQERLERSHLRFCQQLVNLDAQIESLEDMPALEHSYTSLASGVDAHSTLIRETHELVDRVRREMTVLLAPSVPHDDIVPETDDDAVLVARLDALMTDSEFIEAHTAPDEREKVRRTLAALPHVPTTEPVAVTDPYDAEAALGLA